MAEQYTARVIVGNKYVGEKITAEFTGTLQEIVWWVETDRDRDGMYPFVQVIELSEIAEYPFYLKEAYQWFTDDERGEKFRAKEDNDLFDTWWNDSGLDVEMHENPMPLTVENVRAYVLYSEENVSHFGQQWRVEITPAESE